MFNCLVSLIKWLLDLHTLAGIVIALLPTLALILFVIRKDLILFNNLKKEIYFLKTNPSQNVDPEIERLSKNKLFKVHKTAIDICENIRNLETQKNAFLILVYDENFPTDKYEKVLDYSFNKQIPLICYSPKKITNKKHNKMFTEHPYVDICNTPTRLISTIFNIAAVTPNEKSLS